MAVSVLEDLDLSRSRDVIVHVTIRFAIGHWLLVVQLSFGTERLCLAVFETFGCKQYLVYDVGLSGSRTIPFEPFPICFIRRFFGKMHRLATIHGTLPSTDKTDATL